MTRPLLAVLKAHPAAVMLCLMLGLAAALAAQHFRHGWPFSLHHAAPSVVTPPAPSPARAPVPASDARATVELDARRLDALGITVAVARVEELAQPIRAVATVAADESRLSHVHARVSGWLEAVEIPAAGTRVEAGQPVAAIFSQELLASQSEYLAARRAAADGPRSAVQQAARERLDVLGMTAAEIAAIERADKPRRLVTLVAPRSGVVLRRGVSVGTAVDPSTEIVSIADLSRVWVVAEVAEADATGIQPGQPATLSFPASGRESFAAAVDFVYPTLSERTRTLRARFSVENRDGRLRPGLYGSAEFRTAPRRVVTVPRDALVDTGASQHVFVVSRDGVFEPRRVRLGTRLTDRVEIRDGLAAGEMVVGSGVFLIDSESRLRASGGAGAAHGGHGGAAPRPESDESHSGHSP